MGYNTPCCCDDGDCPGQTRRRCVENRWAYSSAGSAKGSVFCHIYNFILLYSSVPLLELLIWARSSVWESVRFASIWTSITCPIFPSNFLSSFSDYPLKIECPKNPFFATFFDEKRPIWARSSAGSAKGSVFCHIYNFILLYSSVPLLELLIWAYSSAGRAYGSHP